MFNTAVSTNIILNEYIIYHRKVHMLSYDLSQKKFQNPKILFRTFWTQIEQSGSRLAFTNDPQKCLSGRQAAVYQAVWQTVWQPSGIFLQLSLVY